MNYDEIRKELDEENELLVFAEIEVTDAESELAHAQNEVRDRKKQIKALRQILRAAGEPYEIVLKGVG